MIHYGIKVWTKNTNYISHIRRLGNEGICHFIELYVDIKASDADRDAWQEVGLPVRVHAPHSYSGFNPALPGDLEAKRGVLHKIEEYRKIFKPASIVFHPGITGHIQESIRQLVMFKKEFYDLFQTALIENKPKVGLKDEICCGADPQEIAQVMNATGFGFCLDFGHAACFAAWAKQPWEEVVDEFFRLKPVLFHLSDCRTGSLKDDHLHFGAGDFDLGFIMSRIPEKAYVVIEARHDLPDSLDDFRQDVEHLENVRRGVMARKA